MTTKIKFTNKYENYSPKKGKVFVKESVTDKSKAVDCDIYATLEKYGIQSLMRKAQATEFLYADVTNKPTTITEALELKKNLDEYFKQQPARVRKMFGDSSDIFYEKFKAGQFNEMLNTGILNEELATNYKEAWTNEPTIIKEKTGTSENIPTNPDTGNTEPLAGN